MDANLINIQDDPNRIPSNILLKPAYGAIIRRKSSYIVDSINELYNYIFNRISSLHWENLEIEAKLGKFSFTGDYLHAYEYIKELFKIPTFSSKSSGYKMDFNSGIDEKEFYSIWYFADKEAERNPEIKRLEPSNYKETLYISGKRKSIEYRNGEVIKEEIIKKEDKLHINLRDNGNDIRITACKEMKTDILDDDIPNYTRDKFRVSYKFRFFRLDFTIVYAAKENFVSYEVEFEFEDLKTSVGQFQKYEDFYMIFLRFIQNAFCLYQATLPEFYSEVFACKTKPRFANDSIYGDYIEKNVNFSKLQ